ncbi:hypothetical protein ABNR98_004455 [Salmonella enterica]
MLIKKERYNTYTAGYIAVAVVFALTALVTTRETVTGLWIMYTNIIASGIYTFIASRRILNKP